MIGHPMIEFRGLHRWFGSTHAVNDISFSVPQGCVFGYIGPNGAGKTTSMRVLATLELPTTGDAFVDGFSAIDDPDRVRRRLGFMPDYFEPYDHMNVLDYLDFFARSYGLRGKERLDSLRFVLGFTKLDALAYKPINGLSKGMKQRLCLGRTLIHNPAVLVLDEPAAGLDPRARIELREMIRQLAEDGRTIIISSHILTELAEMCDRVGIIEQGRLLAEGTVDEIQHGRQTHDAPRIRKIRVKVLGGCEGLVNWLAARQLALDAPPTKDELVFLHQGPVEHDATLLREIVLAGFQVAAYGSQTKSLEDVFMQVTAGKIQ